MATTDLSDRLAKIKKSEPAKEIIKQRSVIVRKSMAASGRKPGRKNTWKDPQVNYVRLFTQIPEQDRNMLKSTINGGALNDEFESVDHFINVAVMGLMKEYGINSID